MEVRVSDKITEQCIAVGAAVRSLSRDLAILAEMYAGQTFMVGRGNPGQLTSSIEQLLAPKQVAAMLSVSLSLLEKWRRDGKGPVWVRLDGQRAIRYRRTDILVFIAERAVK